METLGDLSSTHQTQGVWHTVHVWQKIQYNIFFCIFFVLHSFTAYSRCWKQWCVFKMQQQLSKHLSHNFTLVKQQIIFLQQKRSVNYWVLVVLVGRLYLDRVPLAVSPCLQSLYLAAPSSCWLPIHIYCVDRSAASLSADMCVVWSSKAIKSHFNLTFLVDIWLKLLLRLSKGIFRQNGYLYTYIQIRHPDL